MVEKEVVITGLGIVSPMDNGQGVDIFWDGICNGRNVIKPIRSFNVNGDQCQVGGEVSGFEKFLKNSSLRNRERCFKLFALAVQEALRDSGLDIGSENIGISFGSILGDVNSGERYIGLSPSDREVDGNSLLENYSIHSIPTRIANEWGFQGPNICVNTACSSSADAVGIALHQIRSGYVDVMLAGGSDILSEFIFKGFNALGALTKENIVRPFDKNRTGLAISEGAGVLIMEEKEHARRRMARIHSAIAGYGSTVDGYSLVRPREDGTGLSQAINAALADAKICTEDIDYINAHGTGTIQNDLSETNAVKLSFGKNAKSKKISSIKSMIGHTMGAASVIEAICCVKAMNENTMPPTINYETPDSDCDLDYIPNTAYKSRINAAMSLSAGFGGQNSVLVFKNNE